MSYFFSRAAAKSRQFFRGSLRPYYEVFGLEYAYWLAQLNLSTVALIFKFKIENLSRIRKAHGILQFAILEKKGVNSSKLTVLLCGTTLFYTSDEIKSLLNETGKLIIIFNPDKRHKVEALNTWSVGRDVQIRTILSDVSLVERALQLLATLLCFNSASALYEYRLTEFRAIRTRFNTTAKDAVIQSIYTKDLVSPFDLYFLYHFQAANKIWKNIAPASKEQEYLRLMNKKGFPLTEIHFYSDYQKKKILELGYIKSASVVDLIIIKPEPYFADLFKVLDFKVGSENNSIRDMLIIGVWAHGGRDGLRKDFEFSKFLIKIARDNSLKKSFRLVYKSHPNKHHSWLFLKYLKFQGVIIKDASEKIVDLIKKSDVVVSWGSLSTVYAIGLRKKVIYPKNRYINFWVAYEKDDFEMNDLVDVAESVPDVVKSALSGLSDELAMRRQNKLYEIFGLDVPL